MLQLCFPRPTTPRDRLHNIAACVAVMVVLVWSQYSPSVLTQDHTAFQPKGVRWQRVGRIEAKGSAKISATHIICVIVTVPIVQIARNTTGGKDI